MKRIVSLLLGLMMVFMVSTAMAETVTVEPGATLEMKVSLTSANDDGAIIGIKTNEAPVEFAGAVGGNVNDTVPPKAFNDFFVVVNIEGVDIKPDGSGLTGSLDAYTKSNLVTGQIGTLTFTVDEDAEEGTYTVEAYVKEGSCKVDGSVTFEVKKTTDKLLGDVNGDGVIDGRDSVRLMKYLVDDSIEIVEVNSDMNEDGVFDGRDYIRLMKLLVS